MSNPLQILSAPPSDKSALQPHVPLSLSSYHPGPGPQRPGPCLRPPVSTQQPSGPFKIVFLHKCLRLNLEILVGATVDDRIHRPLRQGRSSPQGPGWRRRETPPTSGGTSGVLRTVVPVQILLANSLCLESDSILHLKPKFLLLMLHRRWLSQGCSYHTARGETKLCWLLREPLTMAEPWTPGATSRVTAASIVALRHGPQAWRQIWEQALSDFQASETGLH